MTCPYCENIKRRIYEDENFVAFLKDNPSAVGHVILTTKEHYPIMEQLPDDLIGNMFNVANTVSSILFETLGAKGTNILINNGVEANQAVSHFSIEIIPRKENDGLSFEWGEGNVDKEKQDVAKLKLNKASSSLVLGDGKGKDVGSEETSGGESGESGNESGEESSEDSDNEWIEKAFRRIP